jgi:hypothetical protein
VADQGGSRLAVASIDIQYRQPVLFFKSCVDLLESDELSCDDFVCMIECTLRFPFRNLRVTSVDSLGGINTQRSWQKLVLGKAFHKITLVYIFARLFCTSKANPKPENLLIPGPDNARVTCFGALWLLFLSLLGC